MDVVRRGEIWLVALDPTIGSEIRKSRPCLIISPPEMHNDLRTAIIAPMTTGSRPAPYRILIDFQDKPGLILIDRIRAVDKQRLFRRLGAAPASILSETLRVLQETFAE